MENHDACHCKSSDSTRQTLEEMDFERGIWFAAQNNDMERLKTLLKKGVSPDIEDHSGYTALHYAARNRHVNICRELLDRGANVNATTRSGKATALQRAATQGCNNVIELLLKRNANPDMQDSDGFTALHRAVMSESVGAVKLLIPKTNLNLCDKLGRTAKQLAEQKNLQNLFLEN
ncbi:hypothetical protein TKK_0019253 [Trichogramma kaykai]|uniref:Ankyrin repeat domain-containing protein 39 n=1 Tax=Trichogramma kaykai TaxID=54128 RepID=A0ABD2VU79_9HYME